jgi:hypothetical protein
MVRLAQPAAATPAEPAGKAAEQVAAELDFDDAAERPSPATN